MNIDSLDALFDVDVTDFLSFKEEDDSMDKKDSSKVILESIDAFYVPIRKGELTYIGTQFPIYNLKWNNKKVRCVLNDNRSIVISAKNSQPIRYYYRNIKRIEKRPWMKLVLIFSSQ